jgi:MraZ protein
MHQFLGNIEARADIKGRLFVPAFYRKSLERWEEKALYLETDAVSKCVKLYPESVWKKLDEEFKANLNLWDKEDLKLYRQFTSRVEYAELDSNGRVLIQKKHLDAIEVEIDALFVGVGYYFEIWNKENFEKSLYNEDDFDKAMQQKMGNEKK